MGDEPLRRRGVLTAYPDFRRIWLAMTASMVGSRALGVVYPLLSVTIGHSTVWAGWVTFAWTAPTVLYMLAGAVVDRCDARLVLLWSQLSRAVLIASVVAALLLENLSVWHLLVVAFLEASFALFATLAEIALIPAIVDRKEVGRAAALQEGSVQAAVLAGRPLGGALYGIWPFVPFAVNVLLIGVSLCAVWRLKHTRMPKHRTPIAVDIYIAIRRVRRHRFLRVAVPLTAATNLIFHALVIVFIASSTTNGTPPVVTGVVLAATGIGGLIGTLLAPARTSIGTWIGARTAASGILSWVTDVTGLTRDGRSTLVLHTWLWVCGLVLIAVTDTPLWFGLALTLMGMAGGLSNVTFRTQVVRPCGARP
ncbi:MAG TPA: MFS transporter [Nonomuraea sp.]|nr:MFS transporter [Nonomuraea sp.]